MLWTTTVAVAVALTFVVAVHHLGWGPVIGVSAMFAILGGVLGVCWNEDEGRWRIGLQLAFAAFAMGILLVGTPSFLGNWALIAVPLVLLTWPPLLGLGLRALTDLRLRHDLHDVADDDLERRWRLTTSQLRHPGTTDAVAFALVQERERLLDEMERRDPEHLRMLLSSEVRPS